ncbi:MAG TPA: biotin/lipoyl-containing protein [Bacteroidia bacterium]|nr:biotin/lipoyl-containing protein [Bacteroidia bacterium]
MYKALVNGKEYSIEKKEDQWFINNEAANIDVALLPDGTRHVLFNHGSYHVELLGSDETTKLHTLKINGKKIEVSVKDHFDQLLAQLGMDNLSAAKMNDIKAPMPGMVLSVLVKAGQTIEKGEPLLVLEAMKMENILKSPGSGVIKKVAVAAQDKVEKNQVLISLE